jgi:ribosomal protein L17
MLLVACLLQVKAKVIRSYVDKMITLAKDGSLHARRQVRSSSTPSGRGRKCSTH